ncbi:hypothetical protein A2454_04395 [Candidatus Peribacteria bacterium RIFOXYC2_FULL_55_14]|nr:MAG: hypothetical protein A2454_04395 [Candidatus Peribacteria bacterium RIFOXYC2_FULL_55_14]
MVTENPTQPAKKKRPRAEPLTIELAQRYRTAEDVAHLLSTLDAAGDEGRERALTQAGMSEGQYAHMTHTDFRQRLELAVKTNYPVWRGSHFTLPIELGNTPAKRPAPAVQARPDEAQVASKHTLPPTSTPSPSPAPEAEVPLPDPSTESVTDKQPAVKPPEPAPLPPDPDFSTNEPQTATELATPPPAGAPAKKRRGRPKGLGAKPALQPASEPLAPRRRGRRPKKPESSEPAAPAAAETSPSAGQTVPGEPQPNESLPAARLENLLPITCVSPQVQGLVIKLLAYCCYSDSTETACCQVGLSDAAYMRLLLDSTFSDNIDYQTLFDSVQFIRAHCPQEYRLIETQLRQWYTNPQDPRLPEFPRRLMHAIARQEAQAQQAR